jgi:hypothetical protein
MAAPNDAAVTTTAGASNADERPVQVEVTAEKTSPSAQPVDQDGPSPSQPATTSSQPQASSSQPAPAQASTSESEAPRPNANEPTLHITLMLTNGQRHPYKIDEKYLAARGPVPRASDGTFDPLMLSGYRLKELILMDWRTADWEPAPQSPERIRLINMGHLVDNNKTLRGEIPFYTCKDSMTKTDKAYPQIID